MGASEAQENGTTRVHFDYGEFAKDTFEISDILEGGPLRVEDTVMYFYTLSSDSSISYRATHIVVVRIEEDEAMDRLYLCDHSWRGKFIMCLCQGDRLKGFHCLTCAKLAVKWFANNQAEWKGTHHASRSEKDQTEVSVH